MTDERKKAEETLVDTFDEVFFEGNLDFLELARDAYVAWRIVISKEAVERLREVVSDEYLM